MAIVSSPMRQAVFVNELTSGIFASLRSRIPYWVDHRLRSASCSSRSKFHIISANKRLRTTIHPSSGYEHFRTNNQLLVEGEFGGYICASDTPLLCTFYPASFSLIPFGTFLTYIQSRILWRGFAGDLNIIRESGSGTQPGLSGQS